MNRSSTESKHSRRLYLIGIIGAVLMGAGLSGCGLVGKKVSAFERGTLAKNGMQLVGASKEQAGMNHLFNAREGSVGGFGGSGGGCGCN